MAIINGSNIIGFGKKYKICGKIIWSESRQKVIKPYRGLYCLYDDKGNRVKLTIHDINQKNRYYAFKKTVCFLFFVFLVLASVNIYKTLKFPESL